MALLPELKLIVAEWLVQPPLKLKSFIDPDKISWRWLLQNPNVIYLIEKHLETDPDKIDWSALSWNPNAIHLLEKQWEKDPDKINWNGITQNPNAIHLIENQLKINPDKIDWSGWSRLSQNPSIFEIDQEQYKKDLITVARPRSGEGTR